MKPRGRPTVKPGVQLMIWAYVELMRDRKDGLPRLSARAGCAKLEKDFAEDLKRGRFLTFATIRRHYKEVEANPEQKAQALRLLEIGRRNREILGWDASSWLFLIDPGFVQSKGYEFNVTEDDHFTLKR
jgi:hypothetical protein